MITDDYTKSINYVRGVRGVFKVDSDDYARYIDKFVTIRGVPIPLMPKKKREKRHTIFRPEREKGVYVTIYDAYERVFRHIPDDNFNEFFEGFEGIKVIVPTQPQVKKPYNVLTGNRFVVLKSLGENSTKIDVGTSIQVRGIKFNLMYNGMERYCYMCRSKHGKECPTRMRWEELKELRRKKIGQRKIYSDSTLRSANQLALAANVVCMPGGGLGQLCNVIKLDAQHKGDILLHGGNNEMHAECLEDFVYTIEKAAAKVTELCKDRNITIVLPTVPPEGPSDVGKAQFIEETIKSIPTVKTIKLDEIEYDESLHPSEDGTGEMIRKINEEMNNELILPEAITEITTPKNTLRYSRCTRWGVVDVII